MTKDALAWRTVGSETVLKDRWIDVRVDRCVTPAGVEITPYYVLGYPDWVHVVAVTARREIVLVRQYRHAVGRVLLELPGGAVDAADGDLERAAQRELVEETGFAAPRWRPISTLYPNPATHNNRIHSFLAQDAEPVRAPTPDQGEEGIEVRLMPFEQVVQGLADGLLGQSMQVSSVLLALRMIDVG